MLCKTLILLAICVLQISEISGHGRLLEPVARTSAWRRWPNLFPAEYNDNQMFCGGVDTQWNQNGGKCGICGESWSGERSFEKGGANYRNLILAKYRSGQQIQAVVEVTANHYGYFVFSICNVDGQKTEATQECLDRTPLSDLHGQKNIYIERGKTGRMTFDLKLPAGFKCNHCVFQWKYNTGNSWGVDKVTGESGIGKGPQEQFYGCSDIQIKASKREYEEENEEEEKRADVGAVEVAPAASSQNNAEEIILLQKLIEYHVKRLDALFKAKSYLEENSV